MPHPTSSVEARGWKHFLILHDQVQTGSKHTDSALGGLKRCRKAEQEGAPHLPELLETTLHLLGLAMEARGEHWEAAFPVRRLLLPQAGGHTVMSLYTLLHAAKSQPETSTCIQVGSGRQPHK